MLGIFRGRITVRLRLKSKGGNRLRVLLRGAPLLGGDTLPFHLSPSVNNIFSYLQD